jgi:hypothetical protein
MTLIFIKRVEVPLDLGQLQKEWRAEDLICNIIPPKCN